MIESNDSLSSKDAAKVKNPIKKAHCISNKFFVVIDNGLVERFKINDQDTWFEQELTEHGILLRIHRLKEMEF
jgi:hypothetical protein